MCSVRCVSADRQLDASPELTADLVVGKAVLPPQHDGAPQERSGDGTVADTRQLQVCDRVGDDLVRIIDIPRISCESVTMTRGRQRVSSKRNRPSQKADCR